jgi:hypothetical protein
MADNQDDESWSRRIAGLVVDALVTAKLVAKSEFEHAAEIAQEEIHVRLIAGDRPEPRSENSN